MADREVKFTFKHIPGKQFESIDGKDNQDDLLKWSMKGRMKAQMYSFDQPFHAYEKDQFAMDFMKNPEVLSTLMTVSNNCRWSPVGSPATAMKIMPVPCSVLSMSFFDRLYDNNIVRETGHIQKCLDEFYEDFTISDELRKVLLLEDSDNYDTYSDADREEFLFRLFKHICLGGQLCQYEDTIDKYLSFTKLLYKDIISVQKNPETKELSIVSSVFSLEAEVSLDQCLADLVAYRDGKQPFTTHVGRYDNLVMTGPDGHFEFEGHILTSSNANFTSLKSQFVNRLISNINQRFPQQSLMNSFFVLAMRTINYESSPDEFGNEEIDAILKHFGEQQTHRGFISPAMFDKEEVKKEWGKAKTIVQSLKYPVENMKHLWQLLTEHHRDDIPNMVTLAQLALCLPLHTADCERTFSQQNRIVTKLRNRLLPDNCDKLLRVMTHGKGLQSHDFKQTLNIWISKKKRLIGIKRKSRN